MKKHCITLRALLAALAFLGLSPAWGLSKTFGDGYDGFDAAGNTTDDAVNSAGYEYAYVFACDDDITSNTITFTDSVGSSDITYYTQQTSGNVTGRAALIKLAATSASYTVTAAHSGTPTYRNVGFWLIDSSTTLIVADDSDGAYAGSGGASSTAPDGGTLSNSGASVVAFMSVCIDGASTGNTESSGWTEDADQPENFGVRQIMASRGPETTATMDPAYTLAGSVPWLVFSHSYREGGGGACVPCVMHYRRLGAQ